MAPEHAQSVPILQVHATNVTGLGAVTVVQSLLQALRRCTTVGELRVHVPATGELSEIAAHPPDFQVVRMRRYLPNALSRACESLRPGGALEPALPALVLGDLPLRGLARQVVFVHQLNLLDPEISMHASRAFKFRVARRIFRLNARYVQHVVVQTTAMRDGLVESVPMLRDRCVVIPNPVPTLYSQARRCTPEGGPDGRLRLFYPASPYPHKNHRVLARITHDARLAQHVAEIRLTVAAADIPACRPGVVSFLGRVPAETCLREFTHCDALVFPSLAESLGLPLLEAMQLELPIIAADLPYARAVCGDGAIYFEPHSAESLMRAIQTLHARLETGWQPDWQRQLAALPDSWDDVAQSMVALFANTPR